MKMTPAQPPTIRIWFRNFFYDGREAGKQCRTLSYGSFYSFYAAWEIRAKKKAEIEFVDEHPILVGNGPSCIAGAGTSFTSGSFRLQGGTN